LTSVLSGVALILGNRRSAVLLVTTLKLVSQPRHIRLVGSHQSLQCGADLRLLALELFDHSVDLRLVLNYQTLRCLAVLLVLADQGGLMKLLATVI